MSAVRVKRVTEFKGGDVVLPAMDGAGLDEFLAALVDAETSGSGRLQRPKRVHEFVIGAGGADIELAGDWVVWRLAREVAVEIIEKLRGLAAGDRPCHEYVEPNWLTAGKEPVFGADDPD